ncbi:MAG: DUF3540 domain-containing protein [Acidobacteriota bacterium]
MPITRQSPVAAPSPSLEYGRVLEAAADGFHVATSFGAVRAVRAVSCLVEPDPGDKVLLSVDMAGSAYVLSVLESASALTLAVDGDARLCVRGGSLTLAADKDIALACPGEMAAAAGNMRLHASRGEAVIERVSLVGRALKTQFKRVSSVARSVDQMFRSFTMRAQESTRLVKEHDEVQAGSQRVLVEDLMALHARNHSMIAEEHVVINADQIHMG